jgi:hypothetical protein
MPRAAQNLALAFEPIFTGTVRKYDACDHAGAERSGFVRATIGKREKFAVDFEQADFAAVYLNDFMFAGLKIVGLGNYVSTHCKP